jgi:hypothetical protein
MWNGTGTFRAEFNRKIRNGPRFKMRWNLFRFIPFFELVWNVSAIPDGTEWNWQPWFQDPRSISTHLGLSNLARAIQSCPGTHIYAFFLVPTHNCAKQHHISMPIAKLLLSEPIMVIFDMLVSLLCLLPMPTIASHPLHQFPKTPRQAPTSPSME